MYILTLPNDWRVYPDELRKHASTGISGTRSAIKELRSYGYLTLHKNIDQKGRIASWEYIFHEDPVIERKISDYSIKQPELEIPQVDNPQVDLPHVEKRTLLNTNITNNLLTNNTPLSAGDSATPHHSTFIKQKTIDNEQKELINDILSLDKDPPEGIRRHPPAVEFLRYFSAGWEKRMKKPMQKYEQRQAKGLFSRLAVVCQRYGDLLYPMADEYFKNEFYAKVNYSPFTFLKDETLFNFSSRIKPKVERDGRLAEANKKALEAIARSV